MKTFPLYFRRLDGSWVKVVGTQNQLDEISITVMRAFGVSGVYTEVGFAQMHPHSNVIAEFTL